MGEYYFIEEWKSLRKSTALSSYHNKLKKIKENWRKKLEK
jgi:hypothetical protein